MVYNPCVSKPTRCRVHPTVIVIDDFLLDPDSVRAFALKQTFDVKGNYPGRRTAPFKTPEIKAAFERILGAEITFWPEQYNGSFQVTTEDMRSWIHRDETDYGGVLYLTPDPDPDSGTTFFRHKKLRVELQTEENKKELGDDSNRESAWDKIDQVGNKYNRLTLFMGRRSHRSTSYFGHNRKTGRLFQTFFFNIRKD